MKNHSPTVLQFADKMKSAGGIMIVTSKYNGGFPARLKNAIELLYPEWKRKLMAIATKCCAYKNNYCNDGCIRGVEEIVY